MGSMSDKKQWVNETRDRNARLAHNLVVVSTREWEKAITGIVAIPTAIALTAAAGATYVAAMLGRGFEMFELAAGEVSRAMTVEPNGAFDVRDDVRMEARA
jgi:hypothetical protein